MLDPFHLRHSSLGDLVVDFPGRGEHFPRHEAEFVRAQKQVLERLAQLKTRLEDCTPPEYVQA